MLAAKPLVPADLSKILCTILRWKQSSPATLYGSDNRYFAMKVGICASGGPDSMALAYLLHNMQHPHDSSVRAFEAHAFIVDHGMRFGSATEAEQVRDNLTSMGIPSIILNMSSVEELGTSKELRSFRNSKTETNARAFRYQAILAAAQQKSIHKLFLGHHHDDQMETLLMKLITQHRSTLSTFKAMSILSPAPYTVQSLGLRTGKIQGTEYNSLELDTEIIGCDESRVELLRPLLHFSKAQLVATCKHFKIPFVSDRTNLDPTFTLRNAVRYLRSHVQLPRALQDSNLRMLQNRAMQNAETEKQRSEDVLANIAISERHLESGMVRVSVRKPCSEVSTRHLSGASVALARFCDLASPINKDLLPSKLPLDETKSILSLIGYNNLAEEILKDGNDRHYQFLKVDFRAVTHDSTTEHTNACSLQISRQSMRKSEVLANSHTIRFRVSLTSNERYSNWIYWDNRYWVRAKLKDTNGFDRLDLMLRPYQPRDVANVRDTLREKERKSMFEKRLRRCAPGHVKYTLPVFVLNGKIVAFPTCDMKLVDSLPFSWNVTFSQPRRAVDFFRT